MRGNKNRILWLVPLTLLGIAVGVQSCAAPAGPEKQSAKGGVVSEPPDPPRPTVNHAAHLAKDLLCTDCHDPEEKGDPKIPDVKICQDCHTDLTKEPERVQAYFNSARQSDGSYRFSRLAYNPDLIMRHPAHAKAKVDCEQCHGKPSDRSFERPAALDLKGRCMDCHSERKASLDCATCHKETRKDRKPGSHDDAFRRTHGGQAPEGWRTAVTGRSTCVLCHEVPQGCNSCHQQSMPGSHRTAGWRMTHGRGVSDALDDPFQETSCALCHAEQSCDRCHQTTKPRSHTSVFERRLHGIQAGIERQTCSVCHKQDTCQRCHESTMPVSHVGNFMHGTQAHCLGCHEPLSSNGCYACHKDTLGHLSATPLPPGPPHSTASTCDGCHVVLPHFDDGGSCRRCHR